MSHPRHGVAFRHLRQRRADQLRRSQGGHRRLHADSCAGTRALQRDRQLPGPNSLVPPHGALLGGDDGPEEFRDTIDPRWIAVITAWLASPEAANVTGRVFDVRGNKLGIAEGWHLGPVAVQPDNPAELGPVMAKLMAEARLNAGMDGKDHEGLGFPSHSI